MSDIVLTDEMKKRLKDAGALGFKLENSFNHVPGAYKNKDDEGDYVIPGQLWPGFTLRELDGVERAKIEDLMRGNVSFEGNRSYIKTDNGKARLKTLQKGIITWVNFYDEDGKLIDKPEKSIIKDEITEESLRAIPTALQIELTNEIMDRSTLTDEDALGLE